MIIKGLKFSVINLGCRANIFESNQIIQLGKENGCIYTQDIAKASVVIINTCCVTNKAMAKSKYMINKVGKLANIKHIVVCGCYSQIEKKLALNNKVQIIIGTKYKTQIFSLLKTYTNKLIKLVENIAKEKEFEFCNNSEVNEKTRGYLKIQDGCNHNCSYCIIPVARGRQRSLEAKIIINDIEKIVKNGIKEIILTGVNTSGYNHDGVSFYELLKKIDALSNDFRVRISSLEPFQINTDIVNLLTKNQERWCQSFHICVQNTCDDVLKIMERKYTITQFIKLCDAIRKKSPNASITTDYIIGFPSETQTQFLESIENLKKIKFANIHMFPFSLHKDTKAAAIKQLFTEKEKQNRYEIIKKNNDTYKNIYLKKFLNKTVNVLFEHPKNPNMQCGKSQYYFDVFVSTKKNLQNSLLKVKITSFKDGNLFGKIM